MTSCLHLNYLPGHTARAAHAAETVGAWLLCLLLLQSYRTSLSMLNSTVLRTTQVSCLGIRTVLVPTSLLLHRMQAASSNEHVTPRAHNPEVLARPFAQAPMRAVLVVVVQRRGADQIVRTARSVAPVVARVQVTCKSCLIDLRCHRRSWSLLSTLQKTILL